MYSLSNKTKLTYVLGCFVLLAYLWHCFALNYVVDDAYITFRYVKNFVNGSGLVFNAGERVEGYTNFLWAMLLSPFLYFSPKINLLLVAQTLGVVFGAATIVLVMRFAVLVKRAVGPWCLVAGAFLALNASFVAWSTGGLETTLFTFLIFAGCFAYVYSAQTDKKHLLAPIIFALAALTRPEGVLVFGVTSIHLVVSEYRAGRPLLSKRTVTWLAMFAAIYAPYYFWRFHYYGYPLPNTFYAKVGSGISQYVRGIRYLRSYAGVYGIFIFLLPLPLVLRRKRENWVDLFLLLVCVYCAYIIYVGGDGLAHFRFLVPISPFIYLMVQEGLREIHDWLKQRLLSGSQWKAAVMACLLVGVSLAFTARQSFAELLFPDRYSWYEPQSELRFPVNEKDHTYKSFDSYFVERQALAAKWLEANAPADAVVASTPAGSIAYNMNLRVIDMLGLNDVHIAHTQNPTLGKDRAGHEKGDGKYVLSRSPDYILLGNVAVLPKQLDEQEMAKKLVRKSEREIWADPDFHDRYELVCVQLNSEGIFRYFTFYRKKATQLSQTTQSR